MSGYEVKNILPGNIPALKPVSKKEPVEKSPQIPASEMSREAHHGLRKSSRRIAVVQSLDILLRHNPELLDHYEAEVERCKANRAP